MIREAFLRAFGSHDMKILSPTLSALIKFGQTIETPHARSLPRFLPKDRISLFQARGQGMIWTNGAHVGVSTVERLMVDALLIKMLMQSALSLLSW